MGTTKSLLFIENRAFAQGELERMINQFSSKEKQKEQSFFTLLQQFMTPEMMKQAEAEHKQMESLFQRPQRTETPKAALAYCDNVHWLPLFIESLCDGHIVYSKELKRLSQQFHTPVFSFSIYDSDALFISYCDDKKGIMYDYIKPNFQGFEEYDSDLYQNDFPQFLLNLCDITKHERLLDIWNEPNEVFADDRMEKIAELFDMKVIYDFSSDLPGFQRIIAK